ncbi:MAG: DinB family protein [Desulfobacterales bacterium]|jgi:hypothetical protein
MGERKNEIIGKLRRQRDATIEWFRSLSPEMLSVQVYEDPDWKVKDVLAHFVTIERSMQWVFEDILQGGPGSPEDFDVDRFNRSQPQKLSGLAVEELIERFSAVRGKTIDLVASMSEEDLDRKGRHAYHGPGTLERFVRWAYEHAEEHEADIRKALSAPSDG